MGKQQCEALLTNREPKKELRRNQKSKGPQFIFIKHLIVITALVVTKGKRENGRAIWETKESVIVPAEGIRRYREETDGKRYTDQVQPGFRLPKELVDLIETQLWKNDLPREENQQRRLNSV